MPPEDPSDKIGFVHHDGSYRQVRPTESIGLPFAALLVAAGISWTLFSGQLPSGVDAMTEPYVPEGQIHPANASIKATESVDGYRHAIQIRVMVNGRSKDGAERATSVNHGFDMLIQYRQVDKDLESESVTACLYFERVWEASLAGADLSTDIEPSIFGSNKSPVFDEQAWSSDGAAPEHCGTRQCSVASVTEQMPWLGKQLPPQSVTSRALWTVSSLHQKTVIIKSSVATGKVIAVQPTGCSLTKNEAEWLARCRLPALFSAAAGADALNWSSEVAQKLLPYDSRLLRDNGLFEDSTTVRELGLEPVIARWRADGQCLRGLHPPEILPLDMHAAADQAKVYFRYEPREHKSTYRVAGIPSSVPIPIGVAPVANPLAVR